MGESGYALTQLLSAVSFLEHADAAALTITPEAFEAGLAESKQVKSQANCQVWTEIRCTPVFT